MVNEIQSQIQVLVDEQRLELSLVTLCLSKMLIALVKLALQMGLQGHLGVALVHCVTQSFCTSNIPSGTQARVLSRVIWGWIPNVYSLSCLSPLKGKGSCWCDRVEIAEEGRKCEVCHQQCEQTVSLCATCYATTCHLQDTQTTPIFGESLVQVLTSLQKWSRDILAWDLIKGLEMLTQPSNQRLVRPTQSRVVNCARIEIAEEGRKCEVCHQQCEQMVLQPHVTYKTYK